MTSVGRDKSMDGFTIKKSDQFLNQSNFMDQRSLRTDNTNSPNISKIQGTVGVEGTDTSNKSFAETLNEAVKSVNQLQKSSDKAAQDLATGRTDNVAEVVLAAEKADVALRVMVQVRNKIIDAYNEIMKMQV